MSTVLLDTTVASLMHPRRAGTPVRLQYEPHLRGNILAVGFQTVAELWLWAERNRWGPRARAALEIYRRRFVVIPYDYDLAMVWARVMAACRDQGRRLEAGDAWVAATAILHRLPLVTHDRDFLSLSLPDPQVISYA